jgi:hypothetical protein
MNLSVGVEITVKGRKGFQAEHRWRCVTGASHRQLRPLALPAWHRASRQVRH